MARPFDRYMVRVGMGSHPKFGRLTDSEFRAHVVGVLAVAAMAPIRGCLLVGELAAEPVDIAKAAGVTVRVARSAMTKLQALGILYRDDELRCLRVHDWDDANPEPKRDPTAAERQRKFRERRVTASNGTRNGTSNGASNGDVTLPEGARVGLPTSPSSFAVDVPNSNDKGNGTSARKPRVDQTAWPDELSPEQRATGAEVLAILRGVWEIRGGATEPQERGVGLGMLRNPRADHVDLARRMQHWFLAGKGQRASTGDVAKRFGDWCAEEPAGRPPRAANGHANGAPSQGDLDARRLASMRKLMGEKGVEFA